MTEKYFSQTEIEEIVRKRVEEEIPKVYDYVNRVLIREMDNRIETLRGELVPRMNKIDNVIESRVKKMVNLKMVNVNARSKREIILMKLNAQQNNEVPNYYEWLMNDFQVTDSLILLTSPNWVAALSKLLKMKIAHHNSIAPIKFYNQLKNQLMCIYNGTHWIEKKYTGFDELYSHLRLKYINTIKTFLNNPEFIEKIDVISQRLNFIPVLNEKTLYTFCKSVFFCIRENSDDL